jgi:hypothetical protein
VWRGGRAKSLGAARFALFNRAKAWPSAHTTT